MMRMHGRWYRFRSEPLTHVLRAALAREVGAKLAGTNNVTLAVHRETNTDDWILEVTTTDRIALGYAAKVCLAAGAEPVRTIAHPPSWTAQPWVDLPLFTRLRLRVGR